ncbi:Toxin-antitoxin system HicB family antitoxin [Candidatus Desulfarcum epimagneticum]|uniref:Toxin-antitoxin system HicB family antitoxin n=1 Tax=uncultured Desulfobacteraceae bacterium TaxID=218296 RepID=A0A484HJW9_9BACT|nr:Toxin-antitoxin system HicB family antitoxin [uncultured Desulfobacteraceae bacterium]
MKKKDRYLKIVEWSNEDQCYVGSIPGWIGKCCHGDNEEDVYRELGRILEEWIEIYEEDGIPLPPGMGSKKYSGKFQLRMDSDLHKALAIRAMQENESLNHFCGKILKKTVAPSGAFWPGRSIEKK